MTDLAPGGPGFSVRQQYRTLLTVSQAIVSQRDLYALFHELVDRLDQVARFDYLALVLHEAATNTMRLHLLETAEPVPPETVIVLPPEEDPAGQVWQTQRPLITSRVAELRHWPRQRSVRSPFIIFTDWRGG
jgi:formate hydrogenlyase transcriptional activator